MSRRTLAANGLGACAIAWLLATGGCAGTQPTLTTTYAGHPGAEKKNCRPEYPAAALRTKAQGSTVIRFTVDASGVVTQADVVQSSGPTPEHRLLDEAARMALAGCPFKPGTDASGQALYGKAGTIVGSSLEGSNTDIADEFTKLIVTQQAYSANTKVITTANNMVQDLLNVLR